MKQNRFKKFIIISLILHLFLLLFFFIFNFQHEKTPQKPIFEDEQPVLITTLLTPYQSPLPQGDTEQAAENTDNKPQQEPQQEMSQQSPQQKTPTVKEPQPEPPPQKQPEEVSPHFPESELTPLTQKLIPEELLQKEISEPQEIVEQKTRELEKLTPQEEQPENLQKIEMVQPRKSLLSMTNSFLKSLKPQGNSFLERDGEDKIPSLKELKYLSYQKKVDETLMNSWRIVRSQRLFRAQPLQMAQPISISFEINEDGSLAHLAMVTSSGDKEFDRLVVESIKQAAPFPPIPKHLGIKRYKPVGGTYRVTW